MSSIYDVFSEDKLKEAESFTLVIQDGETSISFQLARAGGTNKAFATRLNALMKPYKYAMQKGTMKDEDAERILCQALAGTVILGWENVFDRDGEPVEYTEDAAVKLLMDLPSLRQIIQDEASDIKNFLESERQETLGKS